MRKVCVSILAAAAVVAVPLLAHADRNVQAIRLDAHGRASGLILDDGTELVGLAPSTAKIADAVHARDAVKLVIGANDTVQIVDERTKDTLDLGPRQTVEMEPLVGPPFGGGPPDPTVNRGQIARIDDATKLQRFGVDGRVQMITHAGDGAPSGLLLEDGTQVHLLPRVADVALRIPIGTQLHFDGVGTKNDLGRAMWALAISRPDQFVYLDVLRGSVKAPELGLR